MAFRVDRCVRGGRPTKKQRAGLDLPIRGDRCVVCLLSAADKPLAFGSKRSRREDGGTVVTARRAEFLEGRGTPAENFESRVGPTRGWQSACLSPRRTTRRPG